MGGSATESWPHAEYFDIFVSEEEHLLVTNSRSFTSGRRTANADRPPLSSTCKNRFSHKARSAQAAAILVEVRSDHTDVKGPR